LAVYSARLGVGLVLKDATGFLILGGMASLLFVMVLVFAIERKNTIALATALLKRVKQ
jgi:hypothetical protein